MYNIVIFFKGSGCIKTLIINGSPRRNGDTVALLNIAKACLTGDIVELSSYYDNISPCIDCRYCWKNGVCCIKDDMELVYSDDYDNLIIASPVYDSNLPGPVMSLASRLQVYYAAKRFLGIKNELKRKNGILILVGGGAGEPDKAIEYAGRIFKRLNTKISEEEMVFSLKTDSIPAIEDEIATQSIKQLTLKLNQLGKNN